MENKLFLEETLKQVGVELTDKQKNQFIRYYNLLVEKNKVINLTAITEWNDVVIKHFLDSIAINRVINIQEEYSVLDMGTGAGFPGIPLKIVFPNLKITLLDSLNKRVLFLNEVIKELELKDIIAIHGRAEEFCKEDGIRENYDLCVSRAVANLSTLSEYCLPYVKIGGFFIPYKSGEIQNEVTMAKKAVTTLGGKIENIYEFKLPNTDIERSFVVIRKCLNTPKKYPRSSGKPTKNPL